MALGHRREVRRGHGAPSSTLACDSPPLGSWGPLGAAASRPAVADPGLCASVTGRSRRCSRAPLPPAIGKTQALRALLLRSGGLPRARRGAAVADAGRGHRPAQPAPRVGAPARAGRCRCAERPGRHERVRNACATGKAQHRAAMLRSRNGHAPADPRATGQAKAPDFEGRNRPCAPAPNQHNPTAVTRHRRIGRHQPQWFVQRLRHQHPVERVLVQRGKGLQGENMVRPDGQHAVTRLFEGLQGPLRRDGHVDACQSVLDCDLSDRGAADVDFAGLQDQAPCTGRQPLSLGYRQLGDMGVEQQAHTRVSRSSNSR